MNIKAKHGKNRALVNRGKKCSHVFKATPQKAVWTVQSNPTNNRGGPKKVVISVTVFQCMLCGEKKEYPDTWEQNYVIPARKSRVSPLEAKPRRKLNVKNA